MKIHLLLLRTFFVIFVLSLTQCTPKPKDTSAKWGDELMAYATQEYMPADKYVWDWAQATMLRSIADRWENNIDKDNMLKYIRQAMDVSMDKTEGIHPNVVASGFGMAFLARVTGEEKYQQKALEIYEQYLHIVRASNGGVSHRDNVVELWDDTVYMIALFLNEMYKLTGDEQYLKELTFQILAHVEKLEDPETGLWYHGWDNDTIPFDDQCSMLGWANNPYRRGEEFWGRGNGWVAMTLVNTLHLMPQGMKERTALEALYLKMMQTLLGLQDKTTGHWYQLPIYPGEAGNFIESSCTAMFAYAMTVGIADGLLPPATYLPALENACQGIEKFSLKRIEPSRLTLTNVCSGTCVGNKAYYFNRKVVDGNHYALGAAIMFYDQYHLLETASTHRKM
ncbi:family 88 glycosyl hydrolase [Bacteroidia bacterium]|nr:family 88 glycosyl hydrolase [Bacteroidia bacterium]